MYKSYATLAVVVGFSFPAVCAAGFIEFAQPNAVACTLRWRNLDFGPPAGCDDGPLPHNRTMSLTALSTSDGTAVASGVNLIRAWHMFEADYFQVLILLDSRKVKRNAYYHPIRRDVMCGERSACSMYFTASKM